MKSTINLKDKQVLVMGYAMTGRSVVQFLLNQGAQVTLTDRSDLSGDIELQALKEERGLKVVDQGHPITLLDTPYDFMVKNPGIPYTAPFVQAVMAKMIPIYTDIELASWFNESRLIGITGSNGKTTTTQLTYEILKEGLSGPQVFLGGNIGVPILDSIQAAGPEDFLVAELSSFQLEGTREFAVDTAVILNIYRSHLDYHGDRSHYIQAKLRLLAHLNEDKTLIYNYDQAELHDWVKECSARRIPFAMERVDTYVRAHGVYLEDEQIYVRDQSVVSLTDIHLPGRHNIMNVLAAVAIADHYGMNRDHIRQGVCQYAGMPHRIEAVGQLAGRRFYNDSKATNTVATITALSSFQSPIVYIGGGLDRGNGFDDLLPVLGQVKGAFLYGQTKDKMAETFAKVPVPMIERFDTLAEATQAAYQFAQDGDTVLLSPACASWDQFPSFEVRGDTFKTLIQTLMTTRPYKEGEDVND